MFIEVVKSKLHKVTVTDANLQYVGSITIDEALLEAANMIENEKVQIVNINNGERFDTYIIKGERDSGSFFVIMVWFDFRVNRDPFTVADSLSGYGISTVGRASLYHEVFNDTVEQCPVVVAGFCQPDKVIPV